MNTYKFSILIKILHLIITLFKICSLKKFTCSLKILKSQNHEESLMSFLKNIWKLLLLSPQAPCWALIWLLNASFAHIFHPDGIRNHSEHPGRCDEVRPTSGELMNKAADIQHNLMRPKCLRIRTKCLGSVAKSITLGNEST